MSHNMGKQHQPCSSYGSSQRELVSHLPFFPQNEAQLLYLVSSATSRFAFWLMQNFSPNRPLFHLLNIHIHCAGRANLSTACAAYAINRRIVGCRNPFSDSTVNGWDRAKARASRDVCTACIKWTANFHHPLRLLLCLWCSQHPVLVTHGLWSELAGALFWAASE